MGSGSSFRVVLDAERRNFKHLKPLNNIVIQALAMPTCSCSQLRKAPAQPASSSDS